MGTSTIILLDGLKKSLQKLGADEIDHHVADSVLMDLTMRSETYCGVIDVAIRSIIKESLEKNK